MIGTPGARVVMSAVLLTVTVGGVGVGRVLLIVAEEPAVEAVTVLVTLPLAFEFNVAVTLNMTCSLFPNVPIVNLAGLVPAAEAEIPVAPAVLLTCVTEILGTKNWAASVSDTMAFVNVPPELFVAVIWYVTDCPATNVAEAGSVALVNVMPL